MEEPKSTAKRRAKTVAAAQEDKITLLPLSELHDFPNHPFKVRDDEAMQETTESIRQYGVLVPAIVRPREDGGYEIVAGHRRKHGSELAGLQNLPCIVREMDDDTATILMVDSNIQRENILPSERAQAYKMKLEAIRRKAGRPAKTKEKADENHNHRPCRWFAQAPLGPITSRAYRLITELPLHGAPCRYLNSGGVLLIFISKTSPPFYPSFFTNSSLRSDIFSGHS